MSQTQNHTTISLFLKYEAILTCAKINSHKPSKYNFILNFDIKIVWSPFFFELIIQNNYSNDNKTTSKNTFEFSDEFSLENELISEGYSELCQTSKMELFTKIEWHSVVACFCKKLDLRCLIRFWMRFWISEIHQNTVSLHVITNQKFIENDFFRFC